MSRPSGATPRSRRVLLGAVTGVAVIGLLAGCAAGGAPADAETPAADPGAAPVDLTTQTQLTPDFPVDEGVRALLPQSVQDSGTLTVAMATGIAPVNFPGATPDAVSGLTPDLVAALEQIMGVDFQTTIFPSTAAQLLAIDSGQVALTVSTNGDTVERQATYDFVDYINSENSIVVAEGNPEGIRSAADVCGRTYGEVSGSFSLLSTFQEVCAAAGAAEPVLSSFTDAPSMMLALISGRIDAYAGSTFNTIFQQSQGVPVEDVALPEAGSLLLGMTVSKNSPEITAAVDAAMQTMVESGYYQEALDHWGLGAFAIEPGVNLAE